MLMFEDGLNEQRRFLTERLVGFGNACMRLCGGRSRTSKTPRARAPTQGHVHPHTYTHTGRSPRQRRSHRQTAPGQLMF